MLGDRGPIISVRIIGYWKHMGFTLATFCSRPWSQVGTCNKLKLQDELNQPVKPPRPPKQWLCCCSRYVWIEQAVESVCFFLVYLYPYPTVTYTPCTKMLASSHWPFRKGPVDFPFDEQQICAMSIVWSSLQFRSVNHRVYTYVHMCVYIYS